MIIRMPPRVNFLARLMILSSYLPSVRKKHFQGTTGKFGSAIAGMYAHYYVAGILWRAPDQLWGWVHDAGLQ